MEGRRPHLREVEPVQAIAHALWEAHVCIGHWAFCGCLAMLRKAVDVWSADYRDRHGMTFDAAANERDILFWRLKKIAADNKLYADSIHQIIDGLRIDANEAVHDPTVCSGGQGGRYDGADIMAIRQPYLTLHGLISSLVRSTMPGFQLVISDTSRWSTRPPGT